MTAAFNSKNLRRVVTLADFPTGTVDLEKVVVKDATYHGETYPEGVVQLVVGRSTAVPMRDIHKLERLIEETWGTFAHIQISTKNRRPALLIYDHE